MVLTSATALVGRGVTHWVVTMSVSAFSVTKTYSRMSCKHISSMLHGPQSFINKTKILDRNHVEIINKFDMSFYYLKVLIYQLSPADLKSFFFLSFFNWTIIYRLTKKYVLVAIKLDS